ncbi:chromosome segregation protein SMC [Hyphomicrobiales bacterium]|nr:chromosome segregation protein SMC [Hyphomicrobiales bacterium]
MDFKKLRISNFKSFVDPVEVNIGKGLTGVVGPNGCGKSNLVEALRWAMGETSYKSMRTSSMDDVIFSGTENRPARNFAEVSLVLDNKERNAPNEYNNDDIVEVTRRIERESGSAYRINGKDIRARDVQMLFADVSTGARSPSLVRQGQIDELISQKPEQRRRILEEAAGISGFHVRRHEAELRLNAAHTNLERLDDVLKELSSQMRSLKKQAREANRYKSLSEEIRNAQSVVLAVKYETVNEQLDESKKQFNNAIRKHQEAVKEVASLNSNEISLQSELAPLREKVTVDSAKLQRLLIEMEGLDKEILRQKERSGELSRFIDSTTSQLARENDILKDLKDLLSRHGDNEINIKRKQGLENSISNRANDLIKNNTLLSDFSNIYSKKENIEKIISSGNDLKQNILSQIKRENDLLADLSISIDSDAEKNTIKEKEKIITEEIETKVTHLKENDDFVNKMISIYSQKETLSRVIGASFNTNDSLIDELNVKPGYENALDALLGDELYYSINDKEPVYWKSLDEFVDNADLPDGSEALSKYVTGSSAIKRRISQTGIVARENGIKLISKLKYGQCLVSKEGDLWRWDGLVAASKSSSSAAERLQNRNQLEDILKTIDEFEEKFKSINIIKEKSIKIQNDITNLKIELDRVNTEINNKVNLDKKISLSKEELSSLNLRLVDFNKDSLENLEQLDVINASIIDFEAKFKTIDSVRDESEKIQDDITKFKIELDRINSEISNKDDLDKKIPETENQILELDTRLKSLKDEKLKIIDLPDEVENKKNSLQTLIEKSKILKSSSEDNFIKLENQLNEIRIKAKDAAEKEAQARETEGRLEIFSQNNNDKRKEVESLINKELNINFDELIKIINFSDDNPRPSEINAEQNYERFKNERELLGGVNLRAEYELDDIQERFDETKSEREDLDKAISELKKGISGLNQESRERMKLAFEKVNSKFQEVFKKLFGGGSAELNFVDSDDPLEAGLEMLAQPPGKKLKSMDSLSGGEKALTATSLIFAVFLTNPSPICVLDEVDAPLDDANVERFCDLIDEMSKSVNTRFLIITHHALTMSRMDRLFGVTMQEKGVSKLVSVDLSTAEKFRKLA